MSFSSVPHRVHAVRLACLAAVLALGGCSLFDGLLPTDKVDYKSASKQTAGLEVPPDLTQLARDNRSQVQGGAINASALQNRAPGASVLPGTPSSVALNTAGDTRIERIGNERWLRTSRTPEQVWPLLRGFWEERGLALTKDQPELGVMETVWAENRAKLPQDFIRRTIGTVFDFAYATSERDMYRTRVERTGAGTEILISHRGLEEVYSSSEKDSTRWQNRPSDRLLEAEMLSRLLLKLGGKPEDPQTLASGGTGKPTPTLSAGSRAPQLPPLSEIPDTLVVNEGFDRAWRRVGQSLDRFGFTIEDRDRSQGLFFLRYADPDQAGKEEPNFFERLIGSGTPTAAVRYRVSVKSEGERSTVRILDDKGQQQTTDIAKRILGLLQNDLR